MANAPSLERRHIGDGDRLLDHRFRRRVEAGDQLVDLGPGHRLVDVEVLALGLTDAFRSCEDAPGHYTFWDYQGGGWQKDNGIRIDHLLLSPQAASRLQGCAIDKAMRGQEKASDHVPIRCDLAL